MQIVTRHFMVLYTGDIWTGNGQLDRHEREYHVYNILNSQEADKLLPASLIDYILMREQ